MMLKLKNMFLVVVSCLVLLVAFSANAVVINEVDADTAGTDVLEFVELFGAPNEALDGLVVVMMNGSDDASYAAFDLDGFTLDADGYFLLGNADVVPTPSIIFGSNGVQNGADAVALYTGDEADFPNDTPVTTTNLVDAIVYDTSDPDDTGLSILITGNQVQFNENENSNKDFDSIQRCADGTDEYIIAEATPGASNNASCGQVPTEESSWGTIKALYR